MKLLPKRGRIAMMEIFGVIGGAVRPSQYVPLLEAVRRNRAMRALVLDVDSPGGQAAASAELHAAGRRVAQVKPVVAYIRGTGASGAYYVGTAAHRIIAMPDALVGSIGVIAVRPVLGELLQRMGVAMNVQKSGRLKDMHQPWRAPTDEERTVTQRLLDEVYDSFVAAVARGRKLEEAQVRELATGELFTARRAHTLGLVDDLGDAEAAQELAASMAGIRRRVANIRPRRPLFRRLFRGAAEEAALSMLEEVEARMYGRVMMEGPTQRRW